MIDLRTFGDVELTSRFELVRVGAEPCRRFYTLRLTRDRQLALYAGADGGWLLVVIRGRIGGKPIRFERRFIALTNAVRKYKALCARRRRHGYLMIPNDEPELNCHGRYAL